jgi:hypothetical protein
MELCGPDNFPLWNLGRKRDRAVSSRPSRSPMIRGGCKRSPHRLRITGNRFEIGACRLIRLGAPLLPVPKSAERDVITPGEFLLRQPERAAQRFYARHASCCPQLFGRHGPRIGIGIRRRLNLRLPHRPHGPIRKRSLSAIAQHLDNRAVRPNFRGSSRLAHVFLPAGPRSAVCVHRARYCSHARSRLRTCRAN